jgi:hypothetical protein
LTINGDIGDHHLHLTTGALNETSIILGTDEHNVRTTIDGKIQITTPGENSNIWEFGTDGSLTFPSTSGKINPSVSDGGGLQIEAETDFEIKVNQYEGESAIWSFAGTDITFPDGSIQTTAYTGGVVIPDGGTLAFEFGTDFDQTIIGDYGNDSGYIRVEMSGGIETPISTGFYNFLTNLAAGTEFNVYVVNDGTTYNTVVSLTNINSGNPVTVGRNDLYYTYVSGDTLPFSYSATELTLTFESSAFSFTNSAVTFPDGTEQTTAYAPVTGEWNVTEGTNTYSFTVPTGGDTYVMWVKCNIPNGIITWNATVSVTNGNVPAIGSQYAWNYTGGGSPILLTAIPDQIKGTSGSISTDNTYVGTTSNRFDFEIANTSGETQTVYYGYTKV